MPRAMSGPATSRRKKKFFKRAKGFNGMQKSSLRVVINHVFRALAYAYVGRKVKKREYRGIWNVRINAAARKCGTTYSKLIHAMDVKGVELDRKVLADIAVHDPDGFAKLVLAVQA